MDFDIRRSAKGCELNYLFTLFVKEYNRSILIHNIIGLWVISLVMVKIIEELSFKGKISAVLNV